MTIVEAIKRVLSEAGKPLTHNEIFAEIISRRLYEFHSDAPSAIVRSQIRRHCHGLDFPSANRIKHFEIVDGNRYKIFVSTSEKPVPPGAAGAPASSIDVGATAHAHVFVSFANDSAPTLDHVRTSLDAYVRDFTARMLVELRELSPSEFEIFAKQLLLSYGFQDARVTGRSRDGGIDGYGELKMGLGTFTVAFQCKRYGKAKVQRPAIDAFRGALQGRATQGIFFTTSSFTAGALSDSRRSGAIPVVLVDGREIVNLMIKNQFGVQVETLAVPVNAIDLVLLDDKRGN